MYNYIHFGGGGMKSYKNYFENPDFSDKDNSSTGYLVDDLSGIPSEESENRFNQVFLNTVDYKSNDIQNDDENNLQEIPEHHWETFIESTDENNGYMNRVSYYLDNVIQLEDQLSGIELHEAISKGPIKNAIQVAENINNAAMKLEAYKLIKDKLNILSSFNFSSIYASQYYEVQEIVEKFSEELHFHNENEL